MTKKEEVLCEFVLSCEKVIRMDLLTKDVCNVGTKCILCQTTAGGGLDNTFYLPGQQSVYIAKIVRLSGLVEKVVVGSQAPVRGS